MNWPDMTRSPRMWQFRTSFETIGLTVALFRNLWTLIDSYLEKNIQAFMSLDVSKIWLITPQVTFYYKSACGRLTPQKLD